MRAIASSGTTPSRRLEHRLDRVRAGDLGEDAHGDEEDGGDRQEGVVGEGRRDVGHRVGA